MVVDKRVVSLTAAQMNGLESAQQSVSDIKMYQEGHGGVRAGAGRPSGARNKRPTYQAVKAMTAAPYIHRQLKSVEQTGEGGGPQRIVVSWLDPQSPDPSPDVA